MILSASLAHAQGVLTPGVPAGFSKTGAGYVCLPPGARCHLGVGMFAVTVPESAQRMDIRVETDAASTWFDAVMSFGKQPTKPTSGSEYVGDHHVWTGSPGGQPAMTILVRDGDAGLRTGTYYIAFSAELPFDRAAGRITVTLSSEFGVYVHSARNSASNSPYVRVSPGEITVLQGIGIGPEELVVAAPETGVYPTVVGGTRVFFNGTPAPVLYASSRHVAAVAPHSLVVDEGARIQVEHNGRTSNILGVSVDAQNPGIFTQDSTGAGAAAALNQDFTVNGPQNPAKRGSYISIFGTGFGITAPQVSEGQLVPADTLPRMKEPLIVRIGGVDCEVQYAGAAPGLIYGAIQVNVRVPQQAGRGPQRLWMTVGKYRGSMHETQENVVVYVD